MFAPIHTMLEEKNKKTNVGNKKKLNKMSRINKQQKPEGKISVIYLVICVENE